MQRATLMAAVTKLFSASRCSSIRTPVVSRPSVCPRGSARAKRVPDYACRVTPMASLWTAMRRTTVMGDGIACFFVRSAAATTAGFQVISSPAVANELVFIGSDARNVSAFALAGQ